MASYLLINKATNIADNAVEWNGNTDTWQPPNGYFAILISITPSIDWEWNEITQEWEPIETIGNGGIGDSYTDGKLVEPKPTTPLLQPTTFGTQTL